MPSSSLRATKLHVPGAYVWELDKKQRRPWRSKYSAVTDTPTERLIVTLVHAPRVNEKQLARVQTRAFIECK